MFLSVFDAPIQALRLFFLVRLEIVLAYAADRADPIFGNVFESRARLDAGFRIAHFGVVHPLAYGTDILLHRFNRFKFKFISNHECKYTTFWVENSKNAFSLLLF